MKKIILLLIIILLSTNCVNAQSSCSGLFKNIFGKKANEKPISTQPVNKSGMTSSEEAILYYNDSNLKSAFDTILSIRESDRTAQDWFLLGNILQDQDKVSDAIFMYKRAMMIDPKFYKPYYNLGNIYLDDDKNYMAIENFRKANRLNNKFPYAYYNLGCAYLKIGELRKAKIAFLKAIELKNTEPEFHYNLAYTYKMLKNEKLSKQYLGFYNKLIESNQ